MKNTKQKNNGFSMVELIIVITIMAILAASLAPQLIKYVRRSRRATDIQTANEIQASFARAYITMTKDGLSNPAGDTGDAYIRFDTVISDPPQNLAEYAFLELEVIPTSKTNSNYYWHIEYNPATGQVQKISLTDGANGNVSHELYPDSDTFAEGN